MLATDNPYSGSPAPRPVFSQVLKVLFEASGKDMQFYKSRCGFEKST
jgi:hypothetical protein